MTQTLSTKTFIFVLVIIFSTALSGCAGILFGGAATGAAVANDTRTAGTVIEDQAIELKATELIWKDPELNKQSHISTTSYNQVVLLTGQTPTAELRQRAESKVASVAKVRHIHNELTIAAPNSITTRSSDTVLTAKVKTKMFTLDNIDGTKVKVVTENGVVYLMGLLSATDADRAAQAASTVSGVQKVVKLFESSNS